MANAFLDSVFQHKGGYVNAQTLAPANAAVLLALKANAPAGGYTPQYLESIGSNQQIAATANQNFTPSQPAVILGSSGQGVSSFQGGGSGGGGTSLTVNSGGGLDLSGLLIPALIFLGIILLSKK